MAMASGGTVTLSSDPNDAIKTLRMEIAARPIMLNDFLYTCGCSSAAQCVSSSEENMECVNGECVCKSGYTYQRRLNLCTAVIPPATATLKTTDTTFVADNAIDANEGSSMVTDTCASSGVGSGEFLAIDLGTDQFLVYGVSIVAPAPEEFKLDVILSAGSLTTDAEICAQEPILTIYPSSVSSITNTYGADIQAAVDTAQIVCISGSSPWKFFDDINYDADNSILLPEAGTDLPVAVYMDGTTDPSLGTLSTFLSVKKIEFVGFLKVGTKCAVAEFNLATFKLEVLLVEAEAGNTNCDAVYIEPTHPEDEPGVYVFVHLASGSILNFDSSTVGTGPPTLSGVSTTFRFTGNEKSIRNTNTLGSLYLNDFNQRCVNTTTTGTDEVLTLTSFTGTDPTATECPSFVFELQISSALAQFDAVDLEQTSGMAVDSTIPTEPYDTQPCVFVRSINNASLSNGAAVQANSRNPTLAAFIIDEDTDRFLPSIVQDNVTVTYVSTVAGVSDFRILVSSTFDGTSIPDEADYIVCTEFNAYSWPGVKTTFECDEEGIQGRYVFLESTRFGRLQVCDFDVLGLVVPPVIDCSVDTDCQIEGDEIQFCDNQTCSCPEGYHFWPSSQDIKLCIDDNECLDTTRCKNTTLEPMDGFADGTCFNTLGGATCLCEEGYISNLGSNTCENINECLTFNGGCERGCTDASPDLNGTTHMCDCDDIPGFTIALDERSCTDLNECELEVDGITMSICLLALIGTPTNPGICPNGTGDCPDFSENVMCTNFYGSYMCDCPDGYEFNGTYCININECELDNGDCEGNCTDMIPEIDGINYECNCSFWGEGYVLNPFDGKSCIFTGETKSVCQDMDKNDCDGMLLGEDIALMEYDPLDMNDTQTEVRGVCILGGAGPAGYFCSCPNDYYSWNPVTMRCEDIDECMMETSDCEQICMNTAPGYMCDCPEGYQLLTNQESCGDVDECLEEDDMMIDNKCNNYMNDTGPGVIMSMCINTIGSHECECPDGYQLNVTDWLCYDEDDCLVRNGNCESTCENKALDVDGVKRICSCDEGYMIAGNGISCVDADECADYSINNCMNGTMNAFNSSLDVVQGWCVNTAGGFTCECARGYSWNGTVCVDGDECSMLRSPCDQLCANTFGGYECFCEMGYNLTSDLHSCEDIDECTSDMNNCTGTCYNNDGSYTCLCEQGYDLAPDMITCTDIDECADRNGFCQHGCENADGYYNCTCRTGYVLVNYIYCEDIDVCDPMYDPCDNNSFCIYVAGPDKFACEPYLGYTLDEADPSGTTTRDFDECLEGIGLLQNGGCAHECTNFIGSYNCSCFSGYELLPDFRSCIDIDECELQTDFCDRNLGLCYNTPGCFACDCSGAYILNTFSYSCDEEVGFIQITIDLPFTVNFNNPCSPTRSNFTQELEDAINADLASSPFIQALEALYGFLIRIKLVGQFRSGSTVFNLAPALGNLTVEERQLVFWAIAQVLPESGITVGDLNFEVTPEHIGAVLPALTGVLNVTDPCFLYNAMDICQNGGNCSALGNTTVTCNCLDGFGGDDCTTLVSTTTTLAVTTVTDAATVTGSTDSSSSSSGSTVSGATDSSTVSSGSTVSGATDSSTASSGSTASVSTTASSGSTSASASDSSTASVTVTTATTTTTTTVAATTVAPDDNNLTTILLATLIPLGVLLLLGLLACGAMMMRQQNGNVNFDEDDDESIIKSPSSQQTPYNNPYAYYNGYFGGSYSPYGSYGAAYAPTY